MTETQVVNQKMKEVLEENKEGEEVVCERVAVHSHVVKIQAITE